MTDLVVTVPMDLWDDWIAEATRSASARAVPSGGSSSAHRRGSGRPSILETGSTSSPTTLCEATRPSQGLWTTRASGPSVVRVGAAGVMTPAERRRFLREQEVSDGDL